jgi:erythromycin esterase-like protein
MAVRRIARDPADAVSAAAIPLTGAPTDYDALLDLIGDARIVLLGEASHGTHDFYRHRAIITRRLITERGATAVAVEGDWPDAYRVDRFVRGDSNDPDAQVALAGFRRFPSWMWRNADILDFVGWLRIHNDGRQEAARTGFYGLDLYSLGASMEAVIRYLDTEDPVAADRARRRYECLQPYAGTSAEYGQAVLLGVSPSCRRQVIAQLVELRRHSADYLRRDGRAREDAYFTAEQNAVLIGDAEEYYRTMLGDAVTSWNLRDRHMADTLDHLVDHLDRQQAGDARVVVWAHNSHIGDARATEMGDRGELNLGQLMRERHPGEVVLVGFSTATGTVTAASAWGAAPERMHVRPPMAGSYEELFSRTRLPAFLLAPVAGSAGDVLDEVRLQRAIGVIYRPSTERQSHMFASRITRQFDALIHIDRTRAVEPLEYGPSWGLTEPPETYPTAL